MTTPNTQYGTYQEGAIVTLSLLGPSAEAIAEIQAREQATPPVTYSGKPLTALPGTLDYILERDLRRLLEGDVPEPPFMQEQDDLADRLKLQVERNGVLLAKARQEAEELREPNQQKPWRKNKEGSYVKVHGIRKSVRVTKIDLDK